MPDLTHLRLERPSDGRRPADPRQPRPAQRDVGRDDRLWVAAIDELAADRDACGRSWSPARARRSAPAATPRWIASEPDATVDDLRTRMLPFYRAWLSIRTLEVPTIAAVNGAAIGAGLCLALACDLRYAAAGARLGVPFVKLGMHAGHGRHLPAARRRRRRRTPATCCSPAGSSTPTRRCGSGLVSRVIDPATFLDEVLETAAGIAATAPIATRLTKLALRDGGHADLEAACSGRRWPSRSRWPPPTSRRASGPPARSGRRCSPAAEAASGHARARGPRDRARRHLPSPCEMSADGPGASSAAQR